MNLRFVLLLCLVVPSLCAGQVTSDTPATPEPPLPVIDYKACPFEGCSFGKWIVAHDSTLFSTWKEGGKAVAALQKGEVVTGLTGVHITYEPDRVQILQPIPELHLQPGDTILRYMYRGEGFADIWAKGKWRREYDCTFITEKNNSGCLRDCAAKVISEGRKDWWVRVKTSQGSIGWAKVEDQFDCMDSLGGDPQCDNIGASTALIDDKATSIDEARVKFEANLRTPAGKAYNERFEKEFDQKHADTIRLCGKTADNDAENFRMLLKLDNDGRVVEVLLYPRTEPGACVRETLLSNSFSPPPQPAYWAGVYVKVVR